MPLLAVREPDPDEPALGETAFALPLAGSRTGLYEGELAGENGALPCGGLCCCQCGELSALL